MRGNVIEQGSRQPVYAVRPSSRHHCVQRTGLRFHETPLPTWSTWKPFGNRRLYLARLEPVNAIDGIQNIDCKRKFRLNPQHGVRSGPGVDRRKLALRITTPCYGKRFLSLVRDTTA